MMIETAHADKAKILDTLENPSFLARIRLLEEELALVTNNDRIELKINEKLGRESKWLNRTNETFEYFTRMLYLAEKLDDSLAIANACFEIGNNIRLGSVAQTPYEYYFHRAIRIFETFPDDILSQSYLNYLKLLLEPSDSVKFILATNTIRLLLENLDKTDTLIMESLAKNYNVAALYSIGDKSLEFYDKGLKVAKEGGNYLMQVYLLNNLGYTYQQEEDFNRAIPYYLEGLDIALNTGLKSLAANSLNNLTTCYGRLGNYQKALAYHQFFFFMNTSVLNDNYFERLAKEKIIHEVDRVELKNELLLIDQILQSRQRLVLIACVLLILLIAGFIFWSRTKLNIANQKLAGLDQVKSRFFANISHELRTPITLMNGPVESALSGTHGVLSAGLKASLEVARNNGKTLLNLVNEILDLTKLEAKKLVLIENPVYFYSFIQDLMALHHSEATSRSISLNLDYLYDEEISFLIDENKFSKILNNLLSNAFKFSPDTSSIAVKVEAVGDRLTISVKDQGQGIDPADLPYIFDRYYQSERPDAKAQGGTGIGLALSNELVKLHEGTLSANSTLGMGSEFVFSFVPKIIQSNTIQAFNESLDIELIQINLQKTLSRYIDIFEVEQPVLLLTEDHNEMREFIANIVKPYFAVLEAKNGVEALAILGSNRVDLIISDVMMPKMDGFELLEKIKSNETLKDISMIMLTARVAEEDKLFALILGVDDYLTKPFSREELLIRTKNILENRVVRKLSLKGEETDLDRLENTDSTFLNQVKSLVENHLSDGLFTVSYIASEVVMSERQLNRKIKLLTGYSPNQFIREIRMQKAKVLMERNEVKSVADAAYAVGYDKVAYFSKEFTNRFGKRPSDTLVH